jgi:hypothetical protein
MIALDQDCRSADSQPECAVGSRPIHPSMRETRIHCQRTNGGEQINIDSDLMQYLLAKMKRGWIHPIRISCSMTRSTAAS